MFGDPNIHRVIYEPFETATIPGGPYDVILSSPPYFTVEEYAPGQQGQSIVSYPEYNQWMVKFLFTALEKAWTNLKVNGYLILHLGDAKTIITSEATNIFIENYLPGASWEGVIGLQGEAGYPRPVWVWKKLPRYVKRNMWEPEINNTKRTYNSSGTYPQQRKPLSSIERTLYRTYPDLQSELIRNYASKFAPYYDIRLSSAKAIRLHVALKLPSIPLNTIQEILNDDLLISSLLEVKQADGTISILSEYVSSYPKISLSIIHELVPFYQIRVDNANNIREYVALKLPNASKNLINDILKDNLMISSLIEVLDVERTIIWGTAMIKLSLHV
jgi:hypothetical protein